MNCWDVIEVDADAGARQLVASYADRLFGTAWRLCANASTAEDLVFRTLERAMTARDLRFPNEKAYFCWLCTILVNFYRQDMRLKGANALVFVETLPETEDERPDPGEEACLNADRASVREALAALSPLLREAAVLRYFEDFSVPEIAEMLGVPEGTVKFRLHEVRRKIRQLLTQRLVMT